jgi:response regulator RpfG family c-di-GMP phosphodiesterase
MTTWVLAAIAGWVASSIPAVVVAGRFLSLTSVPDTVAEPSRPQVKVTHAQPVSDERRRVAVVDDDRSFRALLATTLASESLEVAEAPSAAEARDLIRLWRPDIVLLDVAMPGLDGLSFCRELKDRAGPPIVVLVTGAELAAGDADAAGADAVLAKPFSPLQLLGVMDRLTGAAAAAPLVVTGTAVAGDAEPDQLLRYARDLNSMFELERAQRRMLENAYRQTVTALATTLEARDMGTRLHSLRVTRYALALAARHGNELVGDPSLVYGFLLHDIGKIGVPDSILLKPGALAPLERRIMQRHPVLGEEILGDVALLEGEGLRVVRSHHERWDGSGYPDALGGSTIPLGARIFAVADALDAMTTNRPYRDAHPWPVAAREVRAQAGRQFDPEVVGTFEEAEPALRQIFYELDKVAA